MPEIEKFFTVQKLILCNICVAASEEFGNRLRALLAGDAMLSPDTGGIVKKTILYFNKHGNEYISRWKLSEAVHTSEDYGITKLEKWGSAAHSEDRPTMCFPIKDPDNNDFYPIAPDK